MGKCSLLLRFKVTENRFVTLAVRRCTIRLVVSLPKPLAIGGQEIDLHTIFQAPAFQIAQQEVLVITTLAAQFVLLFEM